MSSTTSTAASDKANSPSEIDEGVMLTFPQRLMAILSNEENTDTITWLPHGNAFIIYKKKKFAADILPRYFPKQSKFTSFTRKLNRWGFTRITERGPETGAYFNRLFRRDHPSLCLQMACETTVKPWSHQQQQQAQPASSLMSSTSALYSNSNSIASQAAASQASTLQPPATLYSPVTITAQTASSQPPSALYGTAAAIAKQAAATQALAASQMLRHQELQLRLQQQLVTNEALYMQMLQCRRDNFMLVEQIGEASKPKAAAQTQVKESESSKPPAESLTSAIRRATAA